MRTIALIALLSMFTLAPANAANDPEKVFQEVIKLYKSGDTEGALEEARWGVELLEQERQDKVSDLFPDEIGDFKGSELSKNKAMGMMVTERTYSNGGNQVSVSLTEGSAGGGPMAGLGAIAQMAGAFGGGRKVRIQRRTGTAMDDGGSRQIFIGLESGGSLTFESNDLSLDELIKFAEGFPVADIDEARS